MSVHFKRIAEPVARILFLLTSIIAFSYAKSYSQSTASPAAQVLHYLDEQIGIENAGIINGRQYTLVMLGRGTNPFFAAEEKSGIVGYHGQTFRAPLLYDIYKDEVVVKHISNAGVAWFVQLDKTSVDFFNISGHLFRNFTRGFHEIIYEGDDFVIVAKRSKVEVLERGVSKYISNDRYFLLRQNDWQSLANTSSFTSALEDKEDKKAFKSFVRDNGIKVRRFAHDDLVKLGTHLNKLRQRK